MRYFVQELFAQFLGAKGYENALFQNKRQIKSSDITRAIQSTGSLDWLREDFPDVKSTAQSHAEKSRAKSAAAKEKAAALPSGSGFFTPQTSKKSGGITNADEDGQEE